MHFKMNKTKNTVVVVALIIVMFTGCYLMTRAIHGFQGLIGIGSIVAIHATFVWRIIQDYKAELHLNEKGITMYRRGKLYDVKWNEVKSISYRGIRSVQIFDDLIIHTEQGRLNVEYTFTDYKGAWNAIKWYAEKYSPYTVIEQDIPF